MAGDSAHESMRASASEGDLGPAVVVVLGVTVALSATSLSLTGLLERLLKAASQRNCDLLVMGAYGHSRLQELVLGGVTKHVLKHARIPVLMVH